MRLGWGTRARRQAIVALGLAIAYFSLGTPQPGWAQSSGMFGSRNLGGSISGGQGTSFSGTPGSRVESSQQDVGQLSGNERFVRDARQPGQFVGADSADTQNFFSQGGGLTTGQNQFTQFGTGQNSRRTGRNTGSMAGGFGGRQGQQQALRRRLSVGFDVQRPSQAAVSRSLAGHLEGVPRWAPEATIRVSVEGETAVLQGTVTSEANRQLAARMARFEPGIWAVRNELTVVPPEDAATDETLPLPQSR